MSNKLLSLTWGLKPERCSPAERFVLAALADHANDSGECWPSIELLGQETSLCDKTIRCSLKALAGRGWIVIQRKAVGALHRNNAYTLNRAQLEADQRTPVTATAVQDSTPVTATAEQRYLGTSTPVTATATLEPPLTTNRTPISSGSSLRVVSKKKENPVAPPFVLDKSIPTDAWDDFERHRNGMRKPMSDDARWTLQKRLLRFQDEGQDVRELIETAIFKGWQGVFPDSKKQSPYAGVTNPVQAIDKLRRAGYA